MARPVNVTPEIDRWRAKNPLRKWLAGKPRGTVPKVLMPALGVTSKQAVYAWMLGVCKPSYETLLAIQKVTKIDPQEWVKWWRSRPEEGDSEWPSTVSTPSSAPGRPSGKHR
jgi:hypothetical protein